MNADVMKWPVVWPSLKGSGLLLMSWMLDILTDNSQSEVLFWMSLVLTLLGIWDYVLKIWGRYKGPKDEGKDKETKADKSPEQK